MDTQLPERNDLRAVHAFGPEAELAAAQFASLTGRRCGPRLDRPDDVDHHATSVIVTTTEHLSVELLNAMYPAQPSVTEVPGLIFAANAARLGARVRTIAAHHDPPKSAPVTEIYPSWPIDELQVGARHLLGSRAEAATIRDALARQGGILSLLTHSNGFDAMLQGQLALCDAVTVNGRSTSRAPCCRLTGRCYRFGMSIDQAMADGHLLAPHEIGARIIFLCTCNGLLPADAAVDASWGYAEALLGNPGVAAVITSWTYLVPQIAEFHLVLDALYQGVPAGEAVAALNRSASGVRLAVLGDAAARIEPVPGPRIANTSSQADAGLAEPNDPRFLSAFTYAATLESSGELQEKASAAADAVRLFEHAAAKGLTTHGTANLGIGMRRAVLDFAGGCGTNTFLHWIPLTSVRRRIAHTCESCGREADLFQFEFRLATMPQRELLVCPACGIRSDAQAGSPLFVTRVGRTLTLNGPLPTRDWTAIVHLGCQDRSLRTNVNWPSDEFGRPAQHFTPPSPWPPGPLTISVMLVAGVDLTVLTTTGVGDPPDTPAP